MGAGNATRKLSNPTAVPWELDLRAACPSVPATYQLVGVISHHGSHTANQGHYTTLVQSAEAGQWLEYNDASLPQRRSQQFALEAASRAYLLHYAIKKR